MRFVFIEEQLFFWGVGSMQDLIYLGFFSIWYGGIGIGGGSGWDFVSDRILI